MAAPEASGLPGAAQGPPSVPQAEGDLRQVQGDIRVSHQVLGWSLKEEPDKWGKKSR